MESKQRLDDLMYMDFARRAAERSHDLTHKVGCVITKDTNILSYGWNGMPKGMPNAMEYPVMMRHECGCLYLKMRTRKEVQHAEFNALRKLRRRRHAIPGATLYTTLSCCMPCAVEAVKAKIAEVVYDQFFKQEPIEYMLERGIVVRKI